MLLENVILMARFIKTKQNILTTSSGIVTGYPIVRAVHRVIDPRDSQRRS
jgi:hypothetical protein